MAEQKQSYKWRFFIETFPHDECLKSIGLPSTLIALQRGVTNVLTLLLYGMQVFWSLNLQEPDLGGPCRPMQHWSGSHLGQLQGNKVNIAMSCTL